MQNDPVAVTLLPCPFCGGRAFVTIHWEVWCNQDLCLKLPPRASYAEAITAWNTRATTPATGDVREAARNFMFTWWPKWDAEYTTVQAALEQEFTRISTPDSSAVSGAAEGGDGWRPIETAVLWEVYVVTDGENVALAQYAESDHGDAYWSVDPEDCLEWEPTHCIAAPAALTEGKQS